MEKFVTIVPDDKVIMIDGIGYNLNYEIDKNIHAIQWYENSGHIEYKDESPNKEITVDEYDTYIKPYVDIWYIEYERIQEEIRNNEIEYNKIENVISRTLEKINIYCSNCILSGFDYKVNDEVLHFSYDAFDQQNFGDTFNGIMLKKTMGIEYIPDSIEWNCYRNYSETYKDDLVRLVLDVNSFIDIYVNGALIHKKNYMDICGNYKKIIKECTSKEEIENYLNEWNIK